MSIATPRNASLIETIGAGYRALHRRLWVIGIPVALSAYLWLGAPVGVGHASGNLQTALDELSALAGDDGALLVRGIIASDIRVALAWLNFVPVFAPPTGAAPPIGLSGPGQLLAATLLINLLALLLSSYFLTLLSEAVCERKPGHLASLLRSFEVAGAIIRYLLALGGVGLLVALPLLAISALVVMALPQATLAILLAWYIVLFWAYVYTSFAPEAIVVNRAGPLSAIAGSVRVVRRNLAATLGLLLISFVILSGLGLIWQRIAATPGGLAVALIGSAYVGSGLSAARLEFYRERLARRATASPPLRSS